MTGSTTVDVFSSVSSSVWIRGESLFFAQREGADPTAGSVGKRAGHSVLSNGQRLGAGPPGSSPSPGPEPE